MISRIEFRLAVDRCALRAAFVLVALTTASVLGETPSKPIDFLRIEVPKGQLSELGLKAFPVNRQEFEKRIQELNAKHRVLTDPVGTRIISSVYSARLVGEDLVEGRAALQVKHALTEPGYVHLEPLGLAVQALRWRDDDNRRVEVGLASGKNLVVSVEQDDTLEFDWTLRGSRNRESVLQFDLALPDAAINELVLDIPDSHQPLSSQGIVSRVPAGAGPASEASPAEPFRRWRIELGSVTEATIQVVPNDRADDRKPFALVHSSRSYALDASGLEFREIFALRTTDQAVQRLTLDADAGLRVGTVTVDGQPVDLTKRESGPSKKQTYDLAFREPIRGKAELVVTAFARVIFDDPWTLPSTTLRDAVWSAGVMRLEVGDTNLVRRLRSVGSRLRLTGPLPAPRQGDAFDFDLLRPGGSCEVVIRRHEQQKRSKLYTSIRLSDSSVTARVTAELTSVGRPAFSFLLRRDPAWVIDSIETIPADAIQAQSIRGPRGQNRELRLAQAATPESPVRLVVRARRGVEAGEELQGSDLRPIALADALQESSIVAVVAEAPLQLETSGDAHLERVSAQNLSAQDREVFAPEESAFVYRDGPEADELQFAAARTLPRFNSRAKVNATVESEALRVEYFLECEPIASQLSELRVRFSAPIPGAIQWTIVGDRAGTVRARRAADGEQTWELTLPRPRSVSFDLRATTTIPLADAFPIPLVSLPEADTQSGTFVIGTNDGTQLTIEQRGLKAIPINPGSSATHAQIQGVFRYAPSQDVFVGVQPITADSSHRAWVQRAKLTSRWDANGLISHDLRLQVQKFSANHLTLELPPEAFGRGVVIGERSLLWPGEDATLTVPLPRDVTTVTLRLRYDQQVRRGAALTKLQPLLPTLSVPCLDWRWSLWLPPGMAATRDSRLAAGRYPKEPSWDQRLFGYALFRRSGKPCSFLEPATWPSIVGNGGERIRSAESCLARIDEILGENVPREGSLSWGTLLGAVVHAEDAEHRLWIDKAGLAEAGISADTRLPLVPSTDTPAVSLFRQSNLLLVATPRGVVLTTILSQSRRSFGRCVDAGDRILSSDAAPSTVQLVDADSWLRDPATYDASLAAAAASPLDATLVGWTNVTLQVSPDNSSPLMVYEQSKISGFACASFFLTLGLVVWSGGRNTAVPFGLAVITAVVTLFVAEPFVFVCRAAFLAVAAGSLILLLRSKAKRETPSPDDSLSIRLGGGAVLTTGLLVFVAVLIALAARHGTAQDTPAAGAERFARLFEVYYAVDPDGDPVDNNYHVPIEFDQALKELEFQLTAARADWLLAACDYSLTLESNSNGVQLRSMQVDCELTTSSADETQITLPLREQEVQIVEVTVDDRYVYRQWSEDGESLELVVKGALRYRLRMSIRPRVYRDGEQQGFDIRIPSLPTSRLAVRGLSTDQVEISNRTGLVLSDAAGPGFVAELGSLDRLGLSWKADSQAVEVARMINVTQAVWLRPESGLVTVDALIALTVVSGRLEQVALEVDPRLRMLPLRDGVPIKQFGIQQLDEQREARQEISLTLDRTYRSGELVTLPLSFVWPKDPGGLTLTGPLVRPRDLVPDKISVGVSSPIGIRAELTASNSTEMDNGDFAGDWGLMQVPERALQLADGAATWSLRLSPQTPRIATVEETQLVVGRRHASIDYRADIEVAEHPVLQIELQTPATFRIADLRILQADVDIVRRWFTDSQGVTSVLLAGPLMGTAEVVLTGSMDFQDRARVAFVGLRLDAATTASRTIRLYRKPQVLLELKSHSGFSLVETGSLAPPLPELGRLVATMKEGDADQARPLILKLQPNPAEFSGSLATTLRPGPNGWRVEAGLSLRVTSGALDVLRWKLPRELADGVSLDPAYPYEVQNVAGQAEVLLVVTPPEPIAETLELQLRAPLVSADGGRVSAPNIEVLDAHEMVRSLVLPLRSEQEEIVWDTHGLERPVRDDQNVTYHVSGARMRATIRDARRTTGTPRVLLADTLIEWRCDGSYTGLVQFDLAPGGQSSCQLHVPPKVKIVYLQTAGIMSPRKDAGSLAEAGGTLHVPLAIEGLPQRLAVLFSGQASTISVPGKGKYLQVPSVEDFAVDKTLWTIQRVNVDDQHQPLLAHAIRTTQRMQTVRNQQIQAVLQRGQQVSSQHRTDDFATWQTTWTQRLKQTEPGNEPAAERPQSAGLGDLASSESVGAGTIQCELGGAASSMTFIEPRAVSSDLVTRSLVALPRRPPARLLFAASETEADMLYPTGFFAPDPFLFIQKGRRTILVMSDLEMDRARRQARVDRVMSWSKIAAPLEKNGKKPATADVIAAALTKIGLKRVDVPASFPLGLAMELDERGIRLDLVDDPFWPEREVKRPDEVRAIEASLRAAEAGLQAGIEALKSCRIRDGWLKRDGRRFTAEDLRSAINTRVMAEGCVPAHTICAPGDQAVDPHDEGHGPIRAHTPVIMDIFPRSEKTGYFGDLTRTVVRGKASFALHELYAIVHEGVRLGHRRVREGVQGLDVHKEIQALFARQGYKTGVQKGRMQGFFHGTGHGVGLQIHEAPSIGKRPCVLRAGHVVTVEPGLYYIGLGGVRIEDMALVRKRDSRCLTRVPKRLEI